MHDARGCPVGVAGAGGKVPLAERPLPVRQRGLPGIERLQPTVDRAGRAVKREDQGPSTVSLTAATRQTAAAATTWSAGSAAATPAGQFTALAPMGLLSKSYK